MIPSIPDQKPHTSRAPASPNVKATAALTDTEILASPGDAAIELASGRPPRFSRSLGIGILAVIAVVAALYFGRAFFVPLLLGMLASYAFRPVVDWLELRHVYRPVGAALVLAVVVGSTGWVGMALSSQVTAMTEKLPEAARKLRQSYTISARTSQPSALKNVQEAAKEIETVANEATSGTKSRARVAPGPASDSFRWVQDYLLEQLALLLSVAAQAPIVLLLTYFLLASGVHFRRKLVQFVGPSMARKKEALRTLIDIDTQVQRFLLATILSNVLVGVGTWLTFLAIGIEQAGLWGVASGILHFIPYLGPVLIAATSGVAGFMQFGALLPALAVAGTSMLVAGAIGFGFMTWLQSRFAGVNPAVLFIALLFFGWLWGVPGLLLGAPILAIVKVICDHIESLRPFGDLLGK